MISTQSLQKTAKMPPTTYQSSFGSRTRTVEELFLGCLLYYLFSEKPQDRYRGFYFLKAIPDEALTDPALRKIHQALKKTCGKGNGELGRPQQEFMSVFIDNLQDMGGKASVFAEYFGLAMSGELIPALMLREFAQEVLQLWKKRRIAEYQKLIAEKPHDFETLKNIFEKIREIEEYDPIWEDQKAKEEETLLAQAVSAEEIQKEIEWLYPGFLAPGTINFWYAPPSQGKSALALSVALKLLREGKIDKALYFDGDNSITALQQRNLSKLLEDYREKLFYFRPANAREFWQMLQKTRSVRGNILIVVDTLQRMAGKLDINKTTDAIRIMDFFREVVNGREDNPATIIVLHHVNKTPTNGTGYSLIERLKGSATFGDNCDIAYFFTKKNRDSDALYVQLVNSKDRIPVKSKINFKIEVEKGWIEEVEEILSDEEQKFVNLVVSFITQTYRAQNKWPTQEALVSHLKSEGYPFHRARNMLARWEGKFWMRQKDPDTPRGFIYTLPSRNFEILKFYKNVENGPSGGQDENFENLKFCNFKEYQGKENGGGSEAQAKISKFQNFKISKFQDFNGPALEEIPEADAGENLAGEISTSLPSKEEQERLIEEYFKTHDKAPYEKKQEEEKSRDCQKCVHYDGDKESCQQYLGQPVISSSAKWCEFYAPCENKT